MNQSAQDKGSAAKVRALFFVPYGAWMVHNQFDAMIASALRERGAEVLVVGCDGLFEQCYTLARSKNPAQDCLNCAESGKKFFGAFGLPLVQLRDFIDQNELTEIKKTIASVPDAELSGFTHLGMPLGKRIEPAVCSYLRVPLSKLSLPQAVALHREYLAYAILTSNALTRIFAQFKPTHLTLFNGFGFAHSAAFSMGKLHGLQILTHERGFHDGSFMVVSNDVCVSPHPMENVAKLWEKTPLTASELSRVKQFFLNREFGRDMNHHSYFDFQTDHSQVRAQLGIPENAKILSLFTSTEYELIYQWDEFKVVAQQMSVIDRLIDEFKNRSEFLVIRHHPNIGGGPTGAPPDTKLLTHAYEQAARASKNVRIIMPDEKFNSYALLWHSDAVIAFFSTIRLEAAARGLPCAASSIPMVYRGLTHQLDSDNLALLPRLVDSLFESADKVQVDDLVRLYRTAYAHFFRHSVKFQSFEIRNNTEVGINISDMKELGAGRDPNLDRVCGFYLKGESVYQSPSLEEKQRSEEEERSFLTKEISEIKSYRAKVREHARTGSRRVEAKVAVICRDERAKLYQTQYFAHQRHNNYELSTAKEGDLVAALQCSSAPYVLITSDKIQYDESFLLEAISALEKDVKLDAVSPEAWIRTNQGEISGKLFGGSTSRKGYDALIKQVPQAGNLYGVLSLALWRREALLSLLQSENISRDSVAERIFSSFDSSRVLALKTPMLVIHVSSSLAKNGASSWSELLG